MRTKTSKGFVGITMAIVLCSVQEAISETEEASSAQDAGVTWEAAAKMGDILYQSVEELRSFYKLDTGTKGRRRGSLVMSNADVSLEFGPASNELTVDGVRIGLLHPLVRDAKGNFLVSRDDWVQWIDPVLRPTYLAGREEVQTVIIDAGHGGHDKGVQMEAGSEDKLVLQVAEELQKQLAKNGLRVMLTRTGDYFLSDQQRVDAANVYPNAIFLSLHINSASAEKRGPEVYIRSPLSLPGEGARASAVYAPRSAVLAYAVQCALSSAAGVAGGGCGHTHFNLLSSLNMPAVWVELGYATNLQDAALLATAAYREKLAEALARAVTIFAHYASPQARLEVTASPQPIAKPGKKVRSSSRPEKNSEGVRRSKLPKK